MRNLDIRVGVFLLIFWLTLGAVFYIAIRNNGMTITSWWRSPWRNREVGGVANSLHMIGLAWDVIPATKENKTKLAGLGLRVIDEGDHLHAQLI